MFLFIYIITPTDIRKNQTANHGMNVFIRELLAIFLRKVFTEIHLAMIHPIVYSMKDWQSKKGSPFYNNVEEEGVMLC